MGDPIPNYAFTPTAHIESLQAGDSAVELVLGIIELDPPRARRNAAPGRISVFRVIATNFDGPRLRILIWGERIPEFEGTIFRRVIRISRPRVILANPAYADPTRNLMPIELSVQRNTVIQVLGPVQPENAPVVEHRALALRDCGGVMGFVIIECFIRFRIEIQRFGGGTYGSGAVTDGEFHLLVNVTVFDQAASPEVGQHVRISGDMRLNRYNTQILQVAAMNDIHLINAEQMDAARLNDGYRPLPRIAIDQQDVQQVNQQAGGQLGKGGGRDLGQQAAGQLGQQAVGQFRQHAGGQFGHLAGGALGQQLGGQLVQQVDGYQVQQVGGALGQQGGRNLVPQAGGALGQAVGRQVVPQVDRQLVQRVGGQLGQHANGQQAGVQPGQQPERVLNQQVAAQFNQQAAGQLGYQAGCQVAQQRHGGPFAQQANGQLGQQAGLAARQQMVGNAPVAAELYDGQQIELAVGQQRCQQAQFVVEQQHVQPEQAPIEGENPFVAAPEVYEQIEIQDDFQRLVENAQLVYMEPNGEVVEVVDDHSNDVVDDHQDNLRLDDVHDIRGVAGSSHESNGAKGHVTVSNGTTRRTVSVSAKKASRAKRLKKSTGSSREPEFPTFEYKNKVIISDTESDE